MRQTLARRALLRTLGLVERERHPSHLEDFLSPSTLLREVLEAAPADVDALLRGDHATGKQKGWMNRTQSVSSTAGWLASRR